MNQFKVAYLFKNFATSNWIYNLRKEEHRRTGYERLRSVEQQKHTKFGSREWPGSIPLARVPQSSRAPKHRASRYTRIRHWWIDGSFLSPKKISDPHRLSRKAARRFKLHGMLLSSARVHACTRAHLTPVRAPNYPLTIAGVREKRPCACVWVHTPVNSIITLFRGRP